MTDLPLALRRRLAATPPAGADARGRVGQRRRRHGQVAVAARRRGARRDGAHALPRTASTVCVSSQAGCAMGCGFCATGQAGFDRHLTTGEIVEQVVEAANRARAAAGCPTSCSWAWASRWRTTTARGPRSSGSTTTSGCRPATSPSRPSGSCPASGAWPASALPVNLAVSLHAANDELRDELVPINRRYPLAALAEACRAYLDATDRRLSFEWALIDGVNDRDRRRRRAGRLRPPAARPRQPHPAQPDAGLPDAGQPARPGRRLPRPADRARA